MCVHIYLKIYAFAYVHVCACESLWYHTHAGACGRQVKVLGSLDWSCSCCELPDWVLRAMPEPSAGGASALTSALSPQTFIHNPLRFICCVAGISIPSCDWSSLLC